MLFCVQKTSDLSSFKSLYLTRTIKSSARIITTPTPPGTLKVFKQSMATLPSESTSEESQGCDNSGEVPLRVPGSGLNLGWTPPSKSFRPKEQFRHGANDFRARRMTVREVAMLRFMDAVTDKVEWHRKVNDDAIVSKWKDEATSDPESLISEKAFDWCITELRDRASAFESDGLVRTLEGGARVIKSDTVVAPSFRTELRKAVQLLLDQPDAEKDWHPNSDQQVLNLVHPSLFPLVYGKSRVLESGRVGLSNCLERCGDGVVPGADQEGPQMELHNYRRFMNEHATMWSNRFQWLPAEAQFEGETGTQVKLTSYINNLHPLAHHDLYRLVEELISMSIPAWNEVLILGRHGRNDVRVRAYGAEIDPPAEPDWIDDWDWSAGADADSNNEDLMQKLREYMRLPDNPDYQPSEDETELPDDWETKPIKDWEADDRTGEWSFYAAVHWKYNRIRKVLHPEPGVKYSYEQWKVGDSKAGYGDERVRYGQSGFARDSSPVQIEKQFRDRGLQVIVKLASIELSPEKPNYPGGGWHLEGMLNEHIVATAIYYYDVDNCTESRLRFRQESDLDEMSLQYQQDDHDPLMTIFGTEGMRDEPAVQEIGSVDTREGRLLVFPNTLQHKVEPFQLVDPSKPGHRRFIVLWLVDPHFRIMSTRNVPPQQEHWITQHMKADKWNRDIPQEITDKIVDYAKDGSMTLAEAKELRLELMEERTTFKDNIESGFQTYDLCEH